MKQSFWECAWCNYPLFPKFEPDELVTCPKCDTNGYVPVIRSSLEWAWWWDFDARIKWGRGVVYPT